LSSRNLTFQSSQLENLINDLLDDAGNRLKKSKGGVRNMKQTLRFGRRSDPGLLELAPMEELKKYNKLVYALSD